MICFIKVKRFYSSFRFIGYGWGSGWSPIFCKISDIVLHCPCGLLLIIKIRPSLAVLRFYDGPDLKLLIWWCCQNMFVSRLTAVQLGLFCSSILVVCFNNPGISKCLNALLLLSPYLCFIIGFVIVLRFVIVALPGRFSYLFFYLRFICFP